MKHKLIVVLLMLGISTLSHAQGTGDAKGCSQLIEGRERGALSPIGGKWTFVNNCPTAVEFFWCSDAECDRKSGNTWTIRAGGSWPVSGHHVRWGACLGANSGRFNPDGPGYICY